MFQHGSGLSCHQGTDQTVMTATERVVVGRRAGRC